MLSSSPAPNEQPQEYPQACGSLSAFLGENIPDSREIQGQEEQKPVLPQG